MAAKTKWDAVIEEEEVIYDPWVGGGGEDKKTGDPVPFDTRARDKLKELINNNYKIKNQHIRTIYPDISEQDLKDMDQFNPLYTQEQRSLGYSEDFKDIFMRILNGSEEEADLIEKSAVTVIDKQWINNRFIAPFSTIEDSYQFNLFKSTAHVKFADTSVGGNFYCNPRPQFTPYADIRADDILYPFIPSRGGRAVPFSEGQGGFKDMYMTPEVTDNLRPGTLGRYYSEAIDDGVQTVYLQFGVPRFNGLLDIFNSAISYTDAYIASKGRIPKVYMATLPIFQAITCLTMPITGAIAFILKSAGSFIFGNRPYNYYYMEPTMHLYWSSVDTLVNHIATDMGILIPIFNPKGVSSQDKNDKIKEEDNAQMNSVRQGTVMVMDNEYIKRLNSTFMDSYKLFDKTNKVNVYYLMTKYQYRANKIKLNWHKNFKQFIKDPNGYVGGKGQGGSKGGTSTTKSNDKNPATGGKTPDRLGVEDDFKFSKDEVQKDEGNWSSFNVDTDAVSKFLYMQVDDVYSGLSHWMDGLLSFGDYDFPSDLETMQSKDNAFFMKEDTTGKVDPKEKEAIKKKREEAKKNQESDLSGPYKVYQKINFDKALEDPSSVIQTFKDNGWAWWYNVRKGVSDLIDDWSGIYGNTLDATFRGALSQAIFAVEYTGSTSESFSNQVGELAIGENIKRIGKAVKEVKFNTGGMQTGLSAVDKFIDGAMQVFNGALDAVHWSGTDFIRGLLYGGYFDVPKIWEDSSCNMPTISYSMELIAPYGNDISRLQNIVIPLAMIMAGGLPHKVGKSSYASPFLCSCFSKSVQFIRLGMITDISITRGTTNIGHTLDREVNGVTVNFTVTDLSHKMAVPINSTLYNGYQFVLEEENPYADYLVSLAGKNLDDVSFAWKRSKFGYSRVVKDIMGWIRPEGKAGFIGNWVFQSPLAGIFANPQALTANQGGASAT